MTFSETLLIFSEKGRRRTKRAKKLDRKRKKNKESLFLHSKLFSLAEEEDEEETGKAKGPFKNEGVD